MTKREQAMILFNAMNILIKTHHYFSANERQDDAPAPMKIIDGTVGHLAELILDLVEPEDPKELEKAKKELDRARREIEEKVGVAKEKANKEPEAKAPTSVVTCPLCGRPAVRFSCPERWNQAICHNCHIIYNLYTKKIVDVNKE